MVGTCVGFSLSILLKLMIVLLPQIFMTFTPNANCWIFTITLR